ncbi:iron ABC transporter permease [Salmonella enterica subsp. enterica serovar Poona]|nr:iron ABC transporter permease [Salmonella enterica subsp. enterica serovar Poona]HEB6946581.1 iron ABC transporter permease [Salmonella enterica subsp. enterica serovar Hvittingfoss]
MVQYQSVNYNRYKWWSWLLFSFIMLLILLPDLQLFIFAITGWQYGRNSNLWHVLSNPLTWTALYNSLYTSGLGTLFSLLLGNLFAFCLVLTNIRIKQIAFFLVMLPMMIPPQITVMSWLQLFRQIGIIFNSIYLSQGFGWPNPLYSAEGIALLLGIQNTPLVFLLIQTQLKYLPQEYIEAARLSGASFWQTFHDISLPLCRSTIWAGAAIAFVSSLGNFGIPAMLGIPISLLVLPVYIYQILSSFGPAVLNEVAALSLLTGMLTIGIMILQKHMQRHYALPLIGTTDNSLIFSLRSKWRIVIEILLSVLIFSIVIAPLLALIATSLVSTTGVILNSDTFTLSAWKIIFDTQICRAIINSLLLSVSSSLILMLLSLPLAWLLVRNPTRSLIWLYNILDIPYALPGVVLAISFILLFDHPLPLLDISLNGTLTIIFFAYIARFFTVCIKPVYSCMLQLDAAMEEAASLAGANVFQQFSHIVVPLLGPTAFSGAFLVFLSTIHELTVSALLWGPGKETLGVIIFNLNESGDIVQASAISVVVVIIVVLTMLLLNICSKSLPKGFILWQN